MALRWLHVVTCGQLCQPFFGFFGGDMQAGALKIIPGILCIT